MADREIRTRIKLRYDSEENYSSNFTPYQGEVCFVETAQGLKVKVGNNQQSTFADLNFLGDDIRTTVDEGLQLKQDKIVSNYNIMYGKTFIGTKEDFLAANSAGEIGEGCIIVITNGSLDTESSSSTTAKLGTAVLGTMVLGQS